MSPGGSRMNRRASMVLLALALWPGAAAAQSPSGADQQQKLGLRLFNQSCRVCHTKPELITPQYWPVLSMDTLGAKTHAAVPSTRPTPAPAAAPTAGRPGASRDAD